MDKIIKKVLNVIEKNGYEAYVVGGYVRDLLLKRPSYDIDVCTNALPKNIKMMFQKGELTEYGNFFFKIKKYDFEITTYRKEIGYEKRRPKEVVYINNLIEDLLRRDFTINTICMNQNGVIIDLLNGCEDLNYKIVRMVGNPDLKLKEDPLRILRAIRFATILDFEIEQSLNIAIKNNCKELENLSSYRIKEELDKILISENALKGIELLKKNNILKLFKITANNIVKVNDLIGMWAQIDLGVELPFTKEDKNNIIKLKEIIQKGIIDELTLYKYGLYLCTVASEILKLDKRDVNKKYKSLSIYSAKDLCVSSSEICKFLNINKDKKLGEIINELILKILFKEIANTKKDVYKYLQSIKEN